MVRCSGALQGWWSALHWCVVVVCCCAVRRGAVSCGVVPCGGALRCVAVCCRMLRCVTVRCSVLQYVTVCRGAVRGMHGRQACVACLRPCCSLLAQWLALAASEDNVSSSVCMGA